jgi:uncharacterized protein (DUF342 family)
MVVVAGKVEEGMVVVAGTNLGLRRAAFFVKETNYEINN